LVFVFDENIICSLVLSKEEQYSSNIITSSPSFSANNGKKIFFSFAL